MCEVADYCRYLDLLWIAVIGILYGFGVVIAVLKEKRNRRYEDMLDRSLNPGKYDRTRT